jgi:transcriptional regulator with XRE-family HTH domain
MIAMIETGKKNGSVATVKKLAGALKVELEDLVQ